MSQSLYELTGEYLEAMAVLARMEDAGELDEQTVRDTLESISGPLEDKIVAVAKFIRSQEALAEAMKREQERMAARRKSTEALVARMYRYLTDSMKVTAVTKVERPELSVALHKVAASASVYDDLQIPANLWRHPPPPPPAIDRVALLKALKEGPVPGATLVSGEVKAVIK